MSAGTRICPSLEREDRVAITVHDRHIVEVLEVARNNVSIDQFTVTFSNKTNVNSGV